MAGAANSINEPITGIVGMTGTGFTATPVTQHLVQIGGATSSTLAQVAIGSSGQVLTSNGAGVAPTFQTAGAGVSYTTGTFSPTITGSVTNPTFGYVFQAGNYTKIGRLVNVQITLSVNSWTPGLGALFISNMPFTAANGFGTQLGEFDASFVTFTGSYVNCGIDPNATDIRLVQCNSGANHSLLQTSDGSASLSINLSLNYNT